MSDMPHGLVISDLHLLARRADFTRWEQDIFEKLQNLDFCVLNGDIFDFNWSFLPTFQESYLCALEWLNELLLRFPNCRFYYVLGNHDSPPEFVSLLDQRFKENPQLSVHPDLLRLGSNVFLHGDVCHMNMNAGDLDSQRIKYHSSRIAPIGLSRNLMYDALIASRLHHIGPLVNSPAICAGKILNYIGAHPTEEQILHDATDIYFGHTHRVFKDYRKRGLLFHNTGSAIRGLRLQPLEIKFKGKLE